MNEVSPADLTGTCQNDVPHLAANKEIVYMTN